MEFEKFFEKSCADILGPFSPHFGRIGKLVFEEKADNRYLFMGHERFSELDVPGMNKVMWNEILQRAELCSFMTIERTARLATGAVNAYQEKNLLAWAGAARGLIESVADSFYVLRSVAGTLADNHEAIRRCLAGEVSEALVSTKKLEDELIHFTHGRVLKGDEPKTSGHIARSAREYISTLNEPGRPDPYQAYQELCNLTHPSAHTVIWMLDDHDQSEDAYSFRFNPQPKMEYGTILALSLKYRALFFSLLQTTMNSALLALVVCESLGRRGTGTKNIDVCDIPIWNRLVEDISNSSSKNMVRVITGYYKKQT